MWIQIGFLKSKEDILRFLAILALILLMYGGRYLISRRKEKRCPMKTEGEVLRADRLFFWGKMGRIRCSLLIRYRVENREYQTKMRITSDVMVDLSDIAGQTFDMQYNPDHPEEYWVSAKEKRRLGKI